MNLVGPVMSDPSQPSDRRRRIEAEDDLGPSDRGNVAASGRVRSRVRDLHDWSRPLGVAAIVVMAGCSSAATTPRGEARNDQRMQAMDGKRTLRPGRS